jgi:hypothetical protein
MSSSLGGSITSWTAGEAIITAGIPEAMATGPEFVGRSHWSFVTYSLGNSRGSRRRKTTLHKSDFSANANLQTLRSVSSPQSLTYIVDTQVQNETKNKQKNKPNTRSQDKVVLFRKKTIKSTLKKPSTSPVQFRASPPVRIFFGQTRI